MALASQDATGVTQDDNSVNGEALYRQGMAHYRAHQWAQARECFVRLRALEPDRRGLETLLDELDHFIRLEGVRPDLVRPAADQTTAPTMPATATAQRQWFVAVSVVFSVLLLGTLALATSGLFAQQAIPSPPAALQSPLLTARAVNGPLKVQVAGTETWQEWSNGRLLRSGDRIRPDNAGAMELTLPDGKAAVYLAAPALLEIAGTSAEGRTIVRQSAGHASVQTDSQLLILATRHLQAQAMEAGTRFRIDVADESTRICVDKGRVLAAANGGSATVGAGEEATASPGGLSSVGPQATATGTPTPMPSPTLTSQMTTTATPTASPTPTPTQALPTPTPTETPRTVVATATPMPTATPTSTLMPPPLPTPTARPAPPTNTPVPPTNTPLPPTPTPVPPTPTPRR